MSLPSLAVRRPIGVAMCVVAVVALGVVSALRLPIDLLPDLAHPELVVRVAYPDAAPSEVERAVAEPVERALGALPGLQRMESVVRDGASTTTLRFAWGTRMEYAALAARERLDNVRDALPPTATRPSVLRADPSADPVLAVVITRRANVPEGSTEGARAATLHALVGLAADVVARRLEQLDGVASAVVVGAPEREIHVDVDAARLAALGLTMDDVAGSLADASRSAPGGLVRRDGARFAVRTLGELASAAEIADVVVRRSARDLDVAASDARARVPVVRVRDVATIDDGFREPRSVARADGRDAIALMVHKEPSASAVQVARRVGRVVDEVQRAHPSVHVSVASSQARFVVGAIANVAQEVVVGGLLAFLVLFLFLRDARVPVAIALVVPVSLLVACALLDAAGLSLNVMTLGGLALGVGLLLDNSIVVAESVLRRRGLPSSAHAAADGAEEVQAAVLTSTLTTVAVFAPVAYVAGVPGRLFGALSLSIAFALAASALVALTLLPAMAARWTTWPASRRGPLAPALDAFERAFDAFGRRYERVLCVALDHRGAVVMFATTVLALTVVGGLALDRALLPVVDQGEFRARLTMPLGTALDSTAAAVARIDSAIRADPDVAATVLRAGEGAPVPTDVAGGSNVAVLDVRIRDGRATPPVVDRLRALPLPDGVLAIESGGSTTLGALLGSNAPDLVVHVVGADLDAARAYASATAARLAAVTTVAESRVHGGDRRPEVRVSIDRERAAQHATDPRRIAHAVEAAGRGMPATYLASFDHTVPVVVRADDARRRSVDGLRALYVGGVPLRAVASVDETLGPAEIRHVDRERVGVVHLRAVDGDLSRLRDDVARVLRRFPPPAGLRAELAGRGSHLRDGFANLALAFGLAVALVYLILAAEFESLVHPFTVLLSVPLALSGAVFALWLTRTPLSAVSAIGLVVLVGIVDNDAVVKVDCIVRLRRSGLDARAAVIAAGRRRLRPIVINTITALLGLLPMALGLGPGAELQAPLAIAIFGGLLSATALTLVVIPVVYTLLDDARCRTWV